MSLTRSDEIKIKEIVKDEVTVQLQQFKEELSSYIQDMFTKFKSEMYDFFDPILKETKDNREERTLMSHKLSNHENRIEKLEQVNAS